MTKAKELRPKGYARAVAVRRELARVGKDLARLERRPIGVARLYPLAKRLGELRIEAQRLMEGFK